MCYYYHPSNFQEYVFFTARLQIIVIIYRIYIPGCKAGELFCEEAGICVKYNSSIIANSSCCMEGRQYCKARERCQPEDDVCGEIMIFCASSSKVFFLQNVQRVCSFVRELFAVKTSWRSQMRSVAVQKDNSVRKLKDVNPRPVTCKTVVGIW